MDGSGWASIRKFGEMGKVERLEVRVSTKSGAAAELEEGNCVAVPISPSARTDPSSHANRRE